MFVCKEGIDRLNKILHTLVVISNILYTLMGVASIMMGNKILGMTIIGVSIVSAIYHSNEHIFNIKPSTWAIIDQTLVTVTISIYMFLLFLKRKQIYKSKISITLIIVLFICFSLFLCVYYLAIVASDGEKNEENGFIGILYNMNNNEENNIDNEICDKKTKVIKYLIYHVLFHVIGSFTILIFMILYNSKVIK